MLYRLFVGFQPNSKTSLPTINNPTGPRIHSPGCVVEKALFGALLLSSSAIIVGTLCARPWHKPLNWHAFQRHLEDAAVQKQNLVAVEVGDFTLVSRKISSQPRNTQDSTADEGLIPETAVQCSLFFFCCMNYFVDLNK